MAINSTFDWANDSFWLERKMLKSTLDKAGEECQAAMAELVRVEQQAAKDRESAKEAFRKVSQAMDILHGCFTDWAQHFISKALNGSDNREDDMARVFLAGSTETIIWQIKWAEEMERLSAKQEDDDDRQFYAQLAPSLRENASQIAKAMLEVQQIWPWVSPAAVEDAWEQYRNGQLMDFETFKNELQRAKQ